jgi:DNA invertase Pin-like site-specific DNA recombinase
VETAAFYIRTSNEGGLPSREEQLRAIEHYAGANGYTVVASYEDIEAPGKLLFHKPQLKAAIDNIKEREEWQVLIAADPRCFSETESARHELAHKFSLYGNRLECPDREWDEFEAGMKTYRREMSGR